MHPSSRSRSRSSTAIWASMRGRHEVDRRFPVLRVRGAVLGQRGQRGADLVEAQTDLLGDADERDPPHGGAGVTALSPGGTGGTDEALGLVEAQCGGRDPRPLAQRADGQLRLHGDKPTLKEGLTSS